MTSPREARYRLGSFAHQLAPTMTLNSVQAVQLDRLLDEHAGEVRTATLAAIATLLDDHLGHAIDDWLAPGAVDPAGHNVGSDGEPAGDCYKCRRVRDFLRAALLSEENGEKALVAYQLAKARRAHAGASKIGSPNQPVATP